MTEPSEAATAAATTIKPETSKITSPQQTATDQTETEQASSGTKEITETEETKQTPLGEHCTTDRPLPAGSQQSSGEILELDGVQTYVSKPPDYPHTPGRLLLMLTGGTGLHSINNQVQADAWASKGFLVIMPDQFGGDPAPNTGHVTGEPSSGTIIERIKEGVADAAKSFRIDMWLARHGPESVLPAVRKALEAAKEQYADASASGVFGVGYCVGAKYVLLLSGPDKTPTADEEGGEAGPALKAAAIAHGTLVTREDLEAVTQPTLIVAVQSDSLFPEEVLEAGKQSLETRKIKHQVSVYADVPHGFAVVGDYADASIAAKQKESFELMLNWLDSNSS